MKKLGAVALTALLAGSALYPYAVQANEDMIQLKNEEVKDASDYVRAPGVITKIEDSENERMVTVENDQGLITIFRIQDKTLLFNSGTANDMKPADLKKDMKVEAYYDKNKPMILIYPAQITPEIFFVIDEEKPGNVKVGKFDEDFLSVDKELKLNIGEETKIVNQEGDKIKKADLKGKELVVFYSITTRSLPPQTPPTKIIALHPLSDEGTPGVPITVLTIIDTDHYMKDGVKMIPLRKVAEELSYVVRSQSNGALLTKGNVSITITRGEKMYGYNKSLQQFAIAPELIGGNKTYVSEDILELLGNQ
ncbi:copper amine oxidase N-terminal domain-containing protein [Sporosarcina luteola]|uniref:copper amine oxidase N-terminal domain-containing protein n=1 Tax=Sporosarcina luteola TaxID=582850 RepID=UPI002041BB46|nr:copper amine oxidase N-terminal domain-containing protein [Sporosarcina luteola]MCM3742588.1 copper amine oxidase N-terminal domain-containing protein [Sporosarcina luteola]